MTRSRGAKGKPADKPRGKRTRIRGDEKVVPHSPSLVVDQKARIDALTRELAEAREQQTATSEVLKVISSSPGELEPVFNAMLESATRICEAGFGVLGLFDGQDLRHAASHNLPPAFGEVVRPHTVIPRNALVWRVVETKQVLHIPDVTAVEAYDKAPLVEYGGVRSVIAVPMLKENKLAGAITIFRQEVRPFTDKQIELLQNFAAQAVIAIENTRLLNELRESLQQQTATADVLKVISSSPGTLEPVFRTMLENAVRICDAKFGVMHQFDGPISYPVGFLNLPPALDQYLRQRGRRKPLPGSDLETLWKSGRVVHNIDMLETANRDAPSARLAGARTQLAVPMLKDNEVVGSIVIYRQEVRPFTDKQIDLVQNFAAQAVIAIENARLLNELHQRTEDLSESLEQQTATSEVLKVISSSPGDLQPVFDAMLANATKLCEASYGVLWLWDGSNVRAAAMHGALPEAYLERLRGGAAFRAHPDRPGTRAMTERRPVHVADLRTEAAYLAGDPLAVTAADDAGIRTLVSVPMNKDDETIGNITIYRREIRPFSDKQVELLASFAAQAVIAIENTRLLNELREALENQTASADILRTIASSPARAERALDVIAETTARRFGASNVNIRLLDGNVLRYVGSTGSMAAQMQASFPEGPLDPNAASGRAILERRQIYIRADTVDWSGLRWPSHATGLSSTVATPLIREGHAIGALMVMRSDPRPFTDSDLAQLSNFASQAVIAIENTRLLNELRQRTADLSESLEQQTATSEVLRVISSAAGDLQSVFDAMLANATRICEAKFGNLFLLEDNRFRAVALHGEQEYVASWRREPIAEMTEGFPLQRVFVTKKIVHIDDLAKDRTYLDRKTRIVRLVEAAHARTMLAVPMLREDQLVGAITMYRQETRRFTDKQIELVQNFAAQAVIAIENTRLLNELRQRTDDLSESLHQQTATSEVLTVISSSLGQLEPVFETMLEKATRICGAEFGTLYRIENETCRASAFHNASAEFVEFERRRNWFRPKPGSPLSTVIGTKKIGRMTDAVAEGFDVSTTRLAGAKSIVAVPMLKDAVVVGAIVIYRKEAQPFGEKQVELLQNFAAQAVIAIENARLLNELRQRTDDLTESLEQQTATSEVLKVISSSSGDLSAVFESMLANAVRICGAKFGNLHLYKSGKLVTVAQHGAPSAYAELRKRDPVVQITPGSGFDRVARSKQVLQIEDAAADPAHQGHAIVTLGGARTLLDVPMLKDDELVGHIGIYHQAVHPFTDKQIELVQNFAAQAVIAIENTRLLNELRESLQQQTATADVLKVISRSTFDLQAVLDTLVQSAAQLCRADRTTIRIAREGLYHNLADFGFDPAHRERMRSEPLKLDYGSIVGRVALERRPIHILDSQADASSEMAARSKSGNVRSMLGVPLLREGIPIGVLLLQRTVVEAFSDRQVDLATTFADQAVIAIENVRLFDEIQRKSREVEEASKHKSQFLANMSHELRTPLNAIIGYTELIIDGIYGETPEKALAVLKRVESNGRHLLGLINDVLDFSKIEAGQLKLALADYSMKDVVYKVYSAVEPLAVKKNLKFNIDMPPDLPAGHGDEQKLTQVLLNLVGNAIKFTDAGEVAVKVAPANGAFSVAVHDTGPGIDPANQEKLFEEFQQADNSITKAKGGTGLGLAISRRIIELHGGRLWVDSSLGKGAVFTFEVPLVAKQVMPS